MTQEVYLFYGTGSTYSSAKSIYPYIKEFVRDVKSVLDLGCGVGGWAKIFEDNGAGSVVLIDHPSMDPQKLIVDNKKNFIPCNLDKNLPNPLKVDLVVCTEVLEHFYEDRALEILKFITDTSDLVLFSAAIPNQGGCGHLNEQRHLYWHKKFAESGYKFFDGFKLDILPLSDSNYWLRQNLFFYYKPSKEYLFNHLKNVTNEEFELVSNYVLNKDEGVTALLKKLAASIRKSILRRFPSFRNKPSD